MVINFSFLIEILSIPSLVSLPSKIGCKLNEEFKRIGEHYYNNDCSQKCICMENGEFACSPLTCPHGLFPSGSSKNQRFCIEIRSLPFADECCVVLACSNNMLQSINTPSHKEEVTGLSDLNNPKSLTARKVDESENEETLSEFDYQKRLEELEAILNSNITLIKDNEQLAKDKHNVLSKEEFFVNKGSREPLSGKLEEPMTDENGFKILDRVIPSQTEVTALTTISTENVELPTTIQTTTTKDLRTEVSTLLLPTTTPTVAGVITTTENSEPEIITLKEVNANHSEVMHTTPVEGIETEIPQESDFSNITPPEISSQEFHFPSTTVPMLSIVSQEDIKEENLIINHNNTRLDTEHNDNSSFLTLKLDNNTSRDGKGVFTSEGKSNNEPHKVDK